MATKPKTKPCADVPTDFGRHLRACMRCKLLKTFEQVRWRCPSRAHACRVRPATGVMGGLRVRLPLRAATQR
jgi:hypothetical protein